MAVKVGYIGIGAIGSLMAANVIKGGLPLIVYDVRKEAVDAMVRLGAQAAASSREVAQFADIVELSVKDDAQVEEVFLAPQGILAGAKPGLIVAIHSTINPGTAVKIGNVAKQQGVEVVDAPISGGPEGAIARTLLYMIGGEDSPVEKCRPVFETSGTTLVHVGALGTGSMMRIVHHVILGLNRFAADEGMKLAQMLGLDPVIVSKAVHGGEAQSHVVDHYLAKYRDMPTAGLHRIAGIAMRMGYEHGVPMLGPALFQQLYLPTKAKA